MGAFKPLLPFGNKTVIECCIDYLREGGVEGKSVADGDTQWFVGPRLTW